MDKALGTLRGYNRERHGRSASEESSPSSGMPQDYSPEQFRSITASRPSTSDLAHPDGPNSILTETFRVLGIRLKLLRKKSRLKKVVITSAIPEEGKSMVSINLANGMANNCKERVVLVEGDLRRPTLGQRLGCTHLEGLTEYLSSDLLPDKIVYRIEPQGFYFVPAGTPVEDGFELMQSAKLAELFELLEGSFEWIIIDSTPVVPMADTAIWTRLADGVLIVARQGKTEKRLFQKTLESLDGCPLLGIVFNGCKGTMQARYSKYYKYYHSGKKDKGT